MKFTEKVKQNKKKLIPVTVALVLLLAAFAAAMYFHGIISRVDEEGLPVYENYTSIKPAKYFSMFGTRVIYDEKHLDKILPEKTVTLEELNHVCRANDNISVRYKDIICEFNRRLLEKYPSPDYRPYLENLRTMEIREMTSEEICAVSGRSNTYACYDVQGNAVCVPFDEPFNEGTYPFQALYHELCHSVRRYYREDGGRESIYQFNDVNFNCRILEEVLNTQVAVSLLSYKEERPAYIYACNCMDIITECTGAFTVEDYFSRPASWFAVKLNEATGRNDCGYFLRLLEEEYDEMADKGTHSTESYRELYSFLIEIYFAKYYREGMPQERAYALKDELFSKLTRGCVELCRTSEPQFNELVQAYIG